MARHMGGWVKIYRSLVNGDIGNNPYRFTLFSKLIGWANLQESWVEWNGKPRKCPRGSLVTSLKELADSMHCSKATVSKQLGYLALRSSIIIDKSPYGLFIEIPNYEEYQSQDAEVRTQGERSVNAACTQGERKVEHNEERKNKRNKEINIYACEFESLAKAYRKTFSGTTTGPGAKDRFNLQIKTLKDFEDFKKALAHYKVFLDAKEWRQPKQSFATFLGTKSSGFFWRDFVEMPDLESGPKVRPMSEILADEAGGLL